MPFRQNEAVAIRPFGIGRIVLHDVEDRESPESQLPTSDPPGWPDFAAVIISMICRRVVRAIACNSSTFCVFFIKDG